MIGAAGGEIGLDLGAGPHLDQELGELIGLRRQERGGARGPAASSGEQLRIMALDHAAAGARRRHHVVVALEGGDHLRAMERAFAPIAGIVTGLAAAGLAGGTLTRQPESSSSLTAAKPMLGRNKSTRQGNEQGDMRRRGRSSAPMLIAGSDIGDGQGVAIGHGFGKQQEIAADILHVPGEVQRRVAAAPENVAPAPGPLIALPTSWATISGAAGSPVRDGAVPAKAVSSQIGTPSGREFRIDGEAAPGGQGDAQAPIGPSPFIR